MKMILNFFTNIEEFYPKYLNYYILKNTSCLPNLKEFYFLHFFGEIRRDEALPQSIFANNEVKNLKEYALSSMIDQSMEGVNPAERDLSEDIREIFYLLGWIKDNTKIETTKKYFNDLIISLMPSWKFLNLRKAKLRKDLLGAQGRRVIGA